MEQEKKNRFKLCITVFLIYTVIALYNVSLFRSEFRLDHDKTPILETWINEFTGTYTGMIFLPLQLWLLRRFWIRHSNWHWAVPLHLIFSMIIGSLHTGLMTVTRNWLYEPLGLGIYHAGSPLTRLTMEYHKQLIWYIGVIAIVCFLDYQRNLRRREKQMAEQELEVVRLKTDLQQAQLQTLQGQIQPHFLFNTLNMISSIMYEDPAKADTLLSRLCDMLRRGMHGPQRALIPLQQELDYTRSYLELMQARFEDRLILQEDIAAEALSVVTPGFLLQPLVENAIKHNAMDGRSQLQLGIHAHCSDSHLVLSVTDNGLGIRNPAPPAESNGIGITNVRERLRHLYGQQAGLELDNLESGGLRVTVRIPIVNPDRETTPAGQREECR